MKYQFMQEHQHDFKIERMSQVLNVARSGYYRFIKAKPSKRVQENERLRIKIQTIHEESRQTYGAPRIHAELLEDGQMCSRKRVARIM